MRKLIIAVITALSLILVFGPSIFVSLTVPETYKVNTMDEFRGKQSRLTDVAIIHNYQKQGRRVAVVQSSIIYVLGETYDNAYVSVPPGYKTDFASLPSFARLFFNPFGKYSEAAIIHDWLYAISEPGMKLDADRIFYQIMLEDGVSPIVAAHFYTAVRLGTLFNNGGYGNPYEWNTGFYSVDLQVDYPAVCLPEKPETAMISATDVPAMSTVPIDDGSYKNAITALTTGGLNAYLGIFSEAMLSEGCQKVIPDMLTQSVDELFFPLEAGFPAEDAETRERFVNILKLQLLHMQLERQATANSMTTVFLQGYIYESYKTVLPKEFMCLPVIDQIDVMGALFDAEEKRSDVVFPDIECSTWVKQNDDALLERDLKILSLATREEILTQFENNYGAGDLITRAMKADPIPLAVVGIAHINGGFGYEKNLELAMTLLEGPCAVEQARACYELGTLIAEGQPFDNTRSGLPKEKIVPTLYEMGCTGEVMISCHAQALLLKDITTKQAADQAEVLFNRACAGGYKPACEQF